MMKKPKSRNQSSTAAVFLVVLLVTSGLLGRSEAQQRSFPVTLGERVDERSALVCTPKGQGPFPAVVFNHGSGHELFYDVGYWWEDLAVFLREHLLNR